MGAISISLLDRNDKSLSRAPRLTNYAIQPWATRTPTGIVVVGKFGSYFDFTSLHGKTAGQTFSQIQKAMHDRKMAGIAPNGSTKSFSQARTSSRLTASSKDQLLQYLYNWASQSPESVWQVQKVNASSLPLVTVQVPVSFKAQSTTTQKSQTQKSSTKP